jgi:hypothetical protein
MEEIKRKLKLHQILMLQCTLCGAQADRVVNCQLPHAEAVGLVS